MNLTMNDALLLMGMVVLLGALGLWQRKDDAFDLRWLLVDTKTEKVSLMKLGQMVALLTSTWALIYETRNGHLTEWLMTAYMLAWAGANIGSKVVDKMEQK